MSGATPGLVDILSLERIEADLFRSRVVYADPFGLYGGQVAARPCGPPRTPWNPGGTRTRCTGTSSAGATRLAGCC